MRRALPTGVFDDLEVARERPDEVRELRLRATRQVDRIQGIPALDGFPRLETLDLWGQDLRSLEGLGAAKGLRRLALGGNRNLVSLDGIEALPALEDVDVRGCRLDWAAAVASLARLPGLTRLTAGGREQKTPPESLAELRGLLRLTLDGLRETHDVAALVRIAGTMEGLRILDLASDVSRPLPDDLAPLSRLVELTVHMLCPALPPSIGALRGLTTLTLRQNRLRELPEEIGGLESLRELDLSICRLTSVPDSIGRLRALERLSLHFNRRLRRLPDSIGGLVALRELNLGGTPVRELPDAISDLPSLRILHADALASLPDGFERLTLERCSIPRALAKKVTLRAPAVAGAEEVTIAREHGVSLPDPLGDPRVLVIRMPELAEPPDGFAALSRLEELTLVTPRLDLGAALRRLPVPGALRSLVLSRWDRLELPAEIGRFTGLEELSAVGTGLATVPHEIGHLRRLARLVLENDRIESLPEEIGELESLVTLKLGGNPLAALPGSIGRLAALRELQLAGSPLRSLPDELSMLSLTSLAFSGTRFAAPPAVLARIATLQELELEQNVPALDLAKLFVMIGGKPLRRLSVAFNASRALPPEVGELTGVRELDVRHTGIRRLVPELARMESLERLRLDWYRLDDIGRRDAKKCLPPGRWRRANDLVGTVFVKTS